MAVGLASWTVCERGHIKGRPPTRGRPVGEELFAALAVEEESLDRCFQAVPPEDKPKFDKLAKALQEQLSGVKVYKVGDEAEKQVYIVGKTKDGHWAGLKTAVVET